MAQTIRSTPATGTAGISRDAGLAKFQSNVMWLMSVALLVTGFTGMFAMNNEFVFSLIAHMDAKGHPVPGFGWFVVVGLMFLMTFALSGMSQLRSTSVLNTAGFMLYSVIMGLMVAPVLPMYTGVSLIRVCAITAITFGASALYGLMTKRNLDSIGSFLIMGLVGLILTGLVNMFLQSPVIQYLYTFAGLVIFIGLSAWDMQKLEQIYDAAGNTAGAVVNGALSLYLDVINLFLLLLQLFGSRK